MEKPQIKPENFNSVFCEKCKGEIFERVFILKKISKFHSPTGNEMFVNFEVMQCNDCKHINAEFLKPIPKQEKEK